jgi:spore germination protein
VRELRAALPRGTVLSLAIPARTTDAKDAAFVYGDLADIADRLFIMVYDQHWRGGPPGAVSALSWHKEVLRHARSRLPVERVIVGIPFYGRVWQHETVARALQHGKVEELLGEVSAPVRRTGGESPSFTFKKEVTAECWFEDAASLRAKLESAQSLGFPNVGFWRLGQEDPRVWDLLEHG